MSGDTEGGQSVSAKKTVRRKTTARRAAGLATRVAEPDGAGTKRRGADLSILAVGCLVNQSAVSTELFRSNATFLEYDVVVWDPESTIHEYRSREYGAVFQGLPSLGDDASVRLKADVARRRDELTQMLDLGRTVVMFAPTPQSFYVGTGRTETSGTGRNAKETRIVAELSLFSAFPFKLKSVAAAGSKAELRAGEPFASFWKSTSDLLKYRASFEVEDAMPLMTIKGTDRMVGACLQRGKGFVLILPAPYWDSSLENSAKVAAESARSMSRSRFWQRGANGKSCSPAPV